VHLETAVCCFGEPSSIVIPSTVREIGDSVFSYIRSIRDLSFEEGLIRIGPKAFSFCDGIESAAFPASLEVIEKEAFYCCLLGSVTFPVGSLLDCEMLWERTGGPCARES
jgi:hypothetical protein